MSGKLWGEPKPSGVMHPFEKAWANGVPKFLGCKAVERSYPESIWLTKQPAFFWVFWKPVMR